MLFVLYFSFLFLPFYNIILSLSFPSMDFSPFLPAYYRCCRKKLFLRKYSVDIFSKLKGGDEKNGTFV